MAVQQKVLKEMAEKNFSLGKLFIEENGKKEGVKTLPSGLQYKVSTLRSSPARLWRNGSGPDSAQQYSNL